jgi:hypothetical protein
MITDILTYIESYEEIRAVTGLNKQELPDATLALMIYRNTLSKALTNRSGIYAPSTTAQTLQEIFEAPLATTDPLYGAIQIFAVYVIANEVMNSVGLRAYKSIADGKSNITRFSPESTYQDTRKSIADALGSAIQEISDLFGDTPTDMTLLLVVTPDIDLVLGEE